MTNRVMTISAVLIALAGSAFAEMPADEGFQGIAVPLERSVLRVGTVPIWEQLAGLDAAERANARIELACEGRLAREIEALWNAGDYDAALALFPELNPQDVGIAWQTPIPAPETDWETDVLVSTRDSVKEMELDATQTGNRLFCFLRYEGDGNVNKWSGNISTDGGATWAETYTWGANYELPCISTVIVDSHAYIGFPRGVAHNQAFLYRLRTSDGVRVNFPDGGTYFTAGVTGAGDTITELALASNEQTNSSRLYVAYTTNDEQLRVVACVTSNFDTVGFNNEPGDVACGLDVEWNDYPSAHPLVFSYVRNDNKVRVCGFDMVGDIDMLYSGSQTSSNTYTALAIKDDTVMVMFDQQRTSVTQARYLVQYGDGAQWYVGGLGDTALGFSRSGAATGRWEDGVAVAYWQYPQTGHGVAYRWRNYRGTWDPPTYMQDGNTYSAYLPSVERVASGAHGIVFLRAVGSKRAYFDRTDWTGIAERPGRPEPMQQPVVATFVRGILNLRGDARATMHDASGRKVMDLTPGANPVKGLNAGVYFVRRAADQATAKVIINR